jgi:hypothetical protein
MVTNDELTVAEWPDGLCLISVVRPVGNDGAEHVFEIRMCTKIIAVCETLFEAAKLLGRRLPTTITT